MTDHAYADVGLVTDVLEVNRDTLMPILFLLDSPDIEVQRAASAALGNLAVNRAFPLPTSFRLEYFRSHPEY